MGSREGEVFLGRWFVIVQEQYNWQSLPLVLVWGSVARINYSGLSSIYMYLYSFKPQSWMVDGARSTLWSGRYKSGMENTQIIIFLKFRHCEVRDHGTAILNNLSLCYKVCCTKTCVCFYWLQDFRAGLGLEHFWINVARYVHWHA